MPEKSCPGFSVCCAGVVPGSIGAEGFIGLYAIGSLNGSISFCLFCRCACNIFWMLLVCLQWKNSALSISTKHPPTNSADAA
uniref:Uncharacterized protein n=1 Tax=Babesia bovis TaxID=5865 RepID=S6BKA4_BABBO|nr:hypothetical protein [Babesia bovis]